MYDTPFIRQICFTTETRVTLIPVMCNLNLPKCYMKVILMAEQLSLNMRSTTSHILSTKQHSIIQFIRIPNNSMKRNALTKAGIPNIHLHSVAMYDSFQLYSASSVSMSYTSLTFTLTLMCLLCRMEWYKYIERISLLDAHTLISAQVSAMPKYRCMLLTNKLYSIVFSTHSIAHI